MAFADLLLFLSLAFLTNTFFPMPFDPVLLYYASGHSLDVSLWLAVVGSICAGLAGWVDIGIGRPLRRIVPDRWLGLLPFWSGWRFYLGTIVFAVLPLPFSVVRLAAVKEQPEPALYALAIVLGRLPRYLLTAYLCQSLTIPTWVAGAVLLIALGVGLARAERFSVPARS